MRASRRRRRQRRRGALSRPRRGKAQFKLRRFPNSLDLKIHLELWHPLSPKMILREGQDQKTNRTSSHSKFLVLFSRNHRRSNRWMLVYQHLNRLKECLQKCLSPMMSSCNHRTPTSSLNPSKKYERSNRKSLRARNPHLKRAVHQGRLAVKSSRAILKSPLTTTR